MGFGKRSFGANRLVFAGNKWQMVGVHYFRDKKRGGMTKSFVPAA